MFVLVRVVVIGVVMVMVVDLGISSLGLSGGLGMFGFARGGRRKGCVILVEAMVVLGYRDWKSGWKSG